MAEDLTFSDLEYTDVDQQKQRIVDALCHEIEMLPHELDADEAVELVEEVNPQMVLLQEWKLMLGFFRGVIAFRASGRSTSAEYGSKVIKRMAGVYGVSASQLRKERAWVDWFSENIKLFFRFLQTGQTEGYPIRGYHLDELTGTKYNPEQLGAEETFRKMLNTLERGAETMRKAREIAEGKDVDEDELEASSAVFTREAKKLRDSGIEDLESGEVEDAESEMGREMTTKERNFYEAVRRMNCIGCGSPPPSDGANDYHHVMTGGTSIKGFHPVAIPLCRDCHGIADAPGEFYRETGETLERAAARVQFIYWWEIDPTLPRTIQAIQDATAEVS